MRYAYSLTILTTILVLSACGGRSASSPGWDIIPPSCGDGVLDSDEQCDNGAANSDTAVNACRTNCQSASCGDTVIDSGEECDGNNLGGLTCENIGYNGGTLGCRASCELDLSGCVEGPECGDGFCEPPENQNNCPSDCDGFCGNDICEYSEDEWSCPVDCGYCGDGMCGPDEDEWSCPEDCGYCGDGMCGPDEDEWSCPEDCGGWCGDDMCEPGEDQWNCPQDCGTTTPGWGCQSIALCAYCCAPGDLACEIACAQRGSFTAVVETSSLNSCQTTVCSNECSWGMDIDCLMCGWDNCPGICHYRAQGSDGCAGMINCTGNCPTIPTNGNALTCTSSQAVDCYDDCYQSGDAQAEAIYAALMQCIGSHCGALCDPAVDPDLCNQCISNNCQFEQNACLSDY